MPIDVERDKISAKVPDRRFKFYGTVSDGKQKFSDAMQESGLKIPAQVPGKGQNRGSITAEASIIVPLVILSVAAVIYIGTLFYQKAVIQSAAVAAAEAGAAAWPAGTFEFESSRPGFENGRFELYRRIFDSSSEKRLKAIEEYALLLSSRNEIVRPADTVVKAAIKDYAVYRRLEVSITKYYTIPLGRFMGMFGGSDRIRINVKAMSTIDEPVELIRNTDFLIDLERKLEEKFPALKDLGEKTREKMNELKGKLREFAD